LRAPPAKLHQDPPFPTTPYLPAAPHTALISRTHSNARHSPVIARPTSSQGTPTSFSCRACPHHCAPFAIPAIPAVIVPPSFPSRARHHRVQLHALLSPSARPLLPLGLSLDHPPRGVGAHAARPPRRGGSTRFRFEPEVTQYRSSLYSFLKRQPVGYTHRRQQPTGGVTGASVERGAEGGL
jgi:hypothetical protein